VIAEYDNTVLKRRFIYGPGIDEPVMRVDETTGNRYYYFYDGLGSVAALSNISGTIAEQYRYSAFGETKILSPNSELRTTSLYGNPYMFTGRRRSPS
jgi:hypothetical protein